MKFNTHINICQSYVRNSKNVLKAYCFEGINKMEFSMLVETKVFQYIFQLC